MTLKLANYDEEPKLRLVGQRDRKSNPWEVVGSVGGEYEVYIAGEMVVQGDLRSDDSFGRLLDAVEATDGFKTLGRFAKFRLKFKISGCRDDEDLSAKREARRRK